jgi:hypothetical protein
MERHLAVAGRGLAAIGLTGWLAYLIATKTSSVAHPPGWPSWLCLGMFVAGISLYFLGQRRSASSPGRAGEAAQGAATDQDADQAGGSGDLGRYRAGRAATDRRWSNTEDPSAKLLQTLTLSAWIGALLFTASVVLLLQFRSARSVNIANALQQLTVRPISAFLIMILSLFLVTVVTQVFSVDAIATLEGSWGRHGPARLARRLMIQRHVNRKQAIDKHLREELEKAFSLAKARMLKDDVPAAVADAYEAMIYETKPPLLTPEEEEKFHTTYWRDWADAWRLARTDDLVSDANDYPTFSRILPTKLGNLLRATEDRLRNTDGDMRAFVLRRRDILSPRLQMQHDQFRNRLQIYSTLVLVSASLVVLTPIILLGYINVAAIAIISGIFAVLSLASYRAAIESARGYCMTLREMDLDPRHGEY